MMTSGEEELVEANRIVIREYLKTKFPGYTVTETFDRPVCHYFTVKHEKEYKLYKLKVSRLRLSDMSNTPAENQAELDSCDVARRMIERRLLLLDLKLSD